MFSRDDILFGFLAPLILAAAIMLLSRRSWAWPGAMVVGASLLVCFVTRISTPTFRPADSLEWIWVIAVSAMAVGATPDSNRVPRWLHWLAAGIVAVGGTWLLLRPLMPYTWNARVGSLWIGGVGIAVTLAAIACNHLATRSKAMTIPLAMFLIAAASSACLMLSGSVKLAQLCGALTAGLAGISLIAWRRGQFNASRAAIVFQILLSCLLMYGHFYASLSAWPAAMLFVSSFFIFVPEMFHLSGGKAMVVRIIAVLIPLIAAGAITYQEHAKKMDDPTGYYYSSDTGILPVRSVRI